MNDQELISKLQTLKRITPSKQWVFSVKMQILENSQAPVSALQKFRSAQIFSVAYHMVFQRKLAYAFAALAVLIAGSIGLMQLPGDLNIKTASPATLVQAQNNIVELKAKSKELAGIDKSDREHFAVVADGVKVAAKQLTEMIQKDPGVAKEVALEINNNKTYLNVEGSAELKDALSDMYKNTVKPVIEDLDKNKDNLTESQRKALEIAKDLYERDRYTDALESVLLLSISIKND